MAADVCSILGIINTSDAAAKLDQTEFSQLRLNGGRYGRASLLISESGLYKLVMRSDTPEARAFYDWVTKVVFPSIRKDQAYAGSLNKKNLWPSARPLILKVRCTRKGSCMTHDQAMLLITAAHLLVALFALARRN
nr:BRO family protein [Paracoccus saliphilus]